MFRRLGSHSNEAAPAQNDAGSSKIDGPPRVLMTSLQSITASSPAKINWSMRQAPAATPPSTARMTFRRLLWGRRSSDGASGDEDDEVIISDSISKSRRLQESIMVLTREASGDEHEVHCCKQKEANKVVRALKKKADRQIDEGNLSGALQNLNKALAMQQKLYGKKDAAVASTLNRIGEVLSNLGEDYRYMAMSALEESLAIRQELDSGSEDTAVTLRNLWLLLRESNVAISSSDREVSTTVQNFDVDSQAVY